MSRHRLILLAAVFSLAGGAALALTTQEVVDALSAEGYTRIEFKTGPTQTKVEAIRGTEKLEVVYDNASGDTLKSEVGTVEAGEDTTPGVEIRNRKHDFLNGNDGNDDSADDLNDDDNSGSDDNEDGDGGDHDGGDHDGSDHDGSDHDGGDHDGGDGGDD